MTTFGVAWEQLTLDRVRAFMAEAEDEPLLWEAKGTRLEASEVRKQVCGFANSHEGGYLILGADRPRPDTAWETPGVEFPDEPALWIGNLVRNEGVRPVPDFDTRPFALRDGRYVSVTRVRPISVPPCNARGTVYERVSGGTISVRDPQRLAELFARGDQARRAAAERSYRACDWTRSYAEQTVFGPTSGLAKAVVGVACTGNPPDISSRLFTERFEAEIDATVAQHFPADDLGISPVQRDVSQVAMAATRTAKHRLAVAVVTRVYWTGAVALYTLISVTDTAPAMLIEKHIAPSIAAARHLVHALEAFGEAHLTVLVEPGPIRARPTSPRDRYVEIARGPVPLGAVEDHVPSIQRELERAAGERSLEA